MDGRTRESHAVMDGKICKWGDDSHYYAWEDDPAKPGKRKLVRKPRPGNAYMGAPGTDFRCRCVALPYVPEYEDDYEETREKGPVQGVTQEKPAEVVPSAQTLELERRLEMSRRADARHAARTEEQKNAVLAKWNERERKRRIAAAAEKRHEERNEEDIRKEMQKRLETRKKARELLSQMSGIYGVDTDKLRQAIESGNTGKIENEMEPLAKTKKEIESLGDRVDNPMETAKKYGLGRMKDAISAADRTIASWGNISPEEKKEKLAFEIGWVEKKKKYAAWELSRDLYRKELKKVENEIKWNELDAQAKELAEFKKSLPESNSEFTKLMTAVEKAAKGDKYSDKDLKKYSNAVEKAKKFAQGLPQPKVKAQKVPPTLKTLNGAIQDFKKTESYSKELAKHQAEISSRMKRLFDNSDLGMDVNGHIIDLIIDGGFKNTFQTGTSNGYKGSTKTTGEIERTHKRLLVSHKLFMSKASGMKYSGDAWVGRYNGPELNREDYEKYGHLLGKDMVQAYRENLTWYGKTQVRFKKNRVQCTFTAADSLDGEGRYQPSLVSNPDASSFDSLSWKSLNKAMPKNSGRCSTAEDFQYALGISYTELQYHGKLTIDDVESIVLGRAPQTGKFDDTIPPDVARKLIKRGIKVFYVTIDDQLVTYNG